MVSRPRHTVQARLAMLLALLLGAIGGAAAAQQTLGRDSQLPLPRFVALGSGKIYMRMGPGKEFPIKWLYTRQDLPVLIVEESEAWRKVEDPDGETGWIHSSLLAGKRTLMVRGTTADLRRTPSDDALVTARVEAGVIAQALSCQPQWCLVDIGDRRGWLARSSLWGALPDETF